MNTFICATTGPGGSIAPSGNISISYGGGQAFTVTSASCQLLAVIVNGPSIGAQATFIVQNFTGQTTVYASFLVPSSVGPTPNLGGAGDYGFIQHPDMPPRRPRYLQWPGADQTLDTFGDSVSPGCTVLPSIDAAHR